MHKDKSVNLKKKVMKIMLLSCYQNVHFKFFQLL